MLENARNENLDIKYIIYIVDLGVDYIAENFAWEIIGWWLKQHNVNEVIDRLEPGNVKDVDIVSAIVNKYDLTTYEGLSCVEKL